MNANQINIKNTYHLMRFPVPSYMLICEEISPFYYEKTKTQKGKRKAE